MERVEIGLFDRIMDFFKEKILCCSFSMNRFHLSQNPKIELQVQKAAEPDEIIWENLGYDDRYRFFARCKTTLLTVIVLCLCFALIFGISYLQVSKSLYC